MAPCIRLVTASILLSVVRLSTLRPADYEPCDGRPNVRYDTACPTDCSQTDPRITGDKSSLKCSIGHAKEYDGNKSLNTIKDVPPEKLFDPPSLEGIRFYWKKFDGERWAAALNVTFKLPRVNDDRQWPTAIFLKLQSASQQADEHFHSCPLKRVFKIKYEQSSTYDWDNPRNISYDCIVGLNQTKPIAVYILTLETANGGSVNYTITVPMKKKLFERDWGEEWGPVIATQYDPSKKSIGVIVEKAVSGLSKTDCFVLMERTGSGHIEKVKLTQQSQLANFNASADGEYIVKVQYTGCGSCETVSAVTVIGDPVDNTNMPLTEEHLTVILAVVGCICLVVIGVMAVYFCLRARQRKSNPSSSFISTPNNRHIERSVFQPSPADSSLKETIATTLYQPATVDTKLGGSLNPESECLHCSQKSNKPCSKSLGESPSRQTNKYVEGSSVFGTATRKPVHTTDVKGCVKNSYNKLSRPESPSPFIRKSNRKSGLPCDDQTKQKLLPTTSCKMYSQPDHCRCLHRGEKYVSEPYKNLCLIPAGKRNVNKIVTCSRPDETLAKKHFKCDNGKEATFVKTPIPDHYIEETLVKQRHTEGQPCSQEPLMHDVGLQASNEEDSMFDLPEYSYRFGTSWATVPDEWDPPSTDGSLWEIDPGPCCGGRHGRLSYDREQDDIQFHSIIQELSDNTNTPTDRAHDLHEASCDNSRTPDSSILTKMKMFNMSGESLQ